MNSTSTGGPPPLPLLAPSDVHTLRSCLLEASYTAPGVTERLGPVGEAALNRGDLAGVRRAVAGDQDPLPLMIRLFLLGDVVERRAAHRALPVPSALAAGLLREVDDGICTAVDLRPYGEAGGPDWWVVSDLGSEISPGPLDRDHVLGIGPAAVSLAQATVRRPVVRALDVGTGCGVQALHLTTHAQSVVATDVSDRALRFAATTLALSVPDSDVTLRAGSLLDPVEGDRFDLVVANPPFVLGAADHGFTYRDGGRPGDDLGRDLVTALPAVLAPGGIAQVLANWLVTADQPWADRVRGWVQGCDAWIWQRELADLGEYVALWLRDAGDGPHLPGYGARYDAWIDRLRGWGAVAVGMGTVHLRRTDAEPVVVAEDLPQPLNPGLGEAVAGWFDRAASLRRHGHQLGHWTPRLASDVELVRSFRPGSPGWQEAALVLRQHSGVGWRVEVDDAMATVVAACDGTLPLGVLLELVSVAHPDASADLTVRGLAALRDLFSRGFLVGGEPVVSG